MSRAGHTHALARTVQREFQAYAADGYTKAGLEVDDVRIALCGHEARAAWRWGDRFDDNPNNITCPTCNKKLAKAAIKARPVGSGRLEIEADKAAKGGFRFQGGSRVILNGEPIGYVGYEDHGWRIYPLMIERYDDKAAADGAYIRNSPRPLRKDGSTASRGLYSSLGQDVLRFKSKEAAGLGCEQAYRDGLIRTGPELLAEAEQANAAAQVEVQARAERLKARLSEKSETLSALDEILNTKSLSNFQRQGLMNAIALVERQKITGYDTD